MGLRVSAAEAGLLVGRHERRVRAHISRGDLPAKKTQAGEWRIDVDDLPRVRGWVVDRERLAQLEGRQARTYGGLVARVEAMEARARSLEQQLATLEGLIRAALARLPNGGGTSGAASLPEPREPEGRPEEPDGPFTRDDANGLPPTPPAPPTLPQAYRGPATVKLLDRGPGRARPFATRADAARWLERHGVNERTPKSWPGWRHVTLTPDAVLGLAMGLPSDHRRVWRLHRCDDPACVCHELLDASPDGWSA